jgi:drug/metabolite transporter (DMT)-like permease
MQLSETRKGELYILGEALLWSIFPVITILSYASLNPLATLAWSTLFAAVFFGLAMVIKGKTSELKTPGIWPQIFLISFFIGWLFYGFYFSGLKFTTAGNGSIIALMELFFSYLLFNVWKKEYFSKQHTFGAFLMLVGAIIILFPKHGFNFHGGDFLVLVATMCSPFGNYYQQKLRKRISSETMLFLRSMLTFPFVFLLAYLLKLPAGWGSVHNYLWLLLLNGFVALGLSKVWWLEGIHRISVTKANVLSVVAPLLTLVYATILLHQSPTVWQLLAFAPMSAGLLLLTYQKNTAVSPAAL